MSNEVQGTEYRLPTAEDLTQHPYWEDRVGRKYNRLSGRWFMLSLSGAVFVDRQPQEAIRPIDEDDNPISWAEITGK